MANRHVLVELCIRPDGNFKKERTVLRASASPDFLGASFGRVYSVAVPDPDFTPALKLLSSRSPTRRQCGGLYKLDLAHITLAQQNI